MKVIFLSAANSIHTVRWVNALSEKDCDVVLVSLKNHKNYENNINSKIKVIYLPISGNIGYYLNFYFLNKIIRKENPDIVNVHYASGYGTLGRFLEFENKLLNVWGSDIYDFPNENKIKKKILVKNLNAYKAIASTSICMANETKKYIDKDIYITPFGVNINKFKKYEKIDKDRLVIGIVKTLSEKYGIEYLIKAIYELKKIITEEIYDKLEVHIYGKGNLENYLKEMAIKLKTENKIKFLGYISNSDVPIAINEMDIFIVPSIYNSESFGVAAVEAMACEIPVISSDAEGLKEVMEDGVTGFVVPKKNEKAIAEKIKILLENESLRKEMGKNGRKRVLELYNWDNNVNSMLELYEKIEVI